MATTRVAQPMMVDTLVMVMVAITTATLEEVKATTSIVAATQPRATSFISTIPVTSMTPAATIALSSSIDLMVANSTSRLGPATHQAPTTEAQINSFEKSH